MFLEKWENLPEEFHNEEVRKYYNILEKKKRQIFCKRIFDIIFSLILILILALPMIVISLLIKCTSEGKVIFKQKRVTTNGKIFYIYKFRTMYSKKLLNEYQVTMKNDPRITPLGRSLRKTRLDELPQLFNVLNGTMSFVGTRPEVIKYVNHYTPEMYASLLLPAGVTSYTCIKYKDEEEYLDDPTQIEKLYLEKVMAEKMKINLEYIEKFSVFYDISIIIKTVLAVFR